MIEKLEYLLEDFKNVVEDIIEDTPKKVLLSASLVLALTGYMQMSTSQKSINTTPQEQIQVNQTPEIDTEITQITDEELLIRALNELDIQPENNTTFEMLSFMALTSGIDIESILGYNPFPEIEENLIQEDTKQVKDHQTIKREKYEASINSRYDYSEDLKGLKESVSEISLALEENNVILMDAIRSYSSKNIWMNLSMLEKEFQNNLVKAKQNGTLRDINDIHNILEISTEMIEFEKVQMLQIQINPENNTIKSMDDIISTIQQKRIDLLKEYQIVPEQQLNKNSMESS